MGYKYQAASTSSAPSSRSATSSCVHSAPVATEDSSAYSTRHCDAAQAPRVQSSCSSSGSDRSVRFAKQPVFVPKVPYEHHRRAGSSSSQTSITPSLSHSADTEHDDGVECPLTPEFKPVESRIGSRAVQVLSKHISELHLAHAAASSAVDQIVHKFDGQVVAFKHPWELDFAPTQTRLSSPLCPLQPGTGPCSGTSGDLGRSGLGWTESSRMATMGLARPMKKRS